VDIDGGGRDVISGYVDVVASRDFAVGHEEYIAGRTSNFHRDKISFVLFGHACLIYCSAVQIEGSDCGSRAT